MRRWPWFVLLAPILAGLGWRFGTPYVNAGPTVCTESKPDCNPPIACGYIGLQGRIMVDGADACPFVKVLVWDRTRNLFNLAAAPSPRPPLPAGRVYCNGPAGPINPGGKPDQADCVDP